MPLALLHFCLIGACVMFKPYQHIEIDVISKHVCSKHANVTSGAHS